MKKVFLSISIILLASSCSKKIDSDISKEANFTMKPNINFITLERDTNKIKLLDQVFLSKYLDYRPLTQYEIDSIAKTRILNNSKGIIYGECSEYTDYSGLIRLKVFWAKTTQKAHYQELTTVTLPSDWVLVGGGAETFDFNPDTENGGFLTQSLPNPSSNYTSWRGASKDHGVECLHNLKVYAIGMKITGVDPAYLRSNVYYAESPLSAPSNLPTNSVNVPWDYLLIGGGALDYNLGYGNMLTESYPNGQVWYVKGKAHRISAPSPIRAYAIGIRDISYPGVGYLRVSYTTTLASINYGPLWCYCPTITGQALTCTGGIAVYNGMG